MTSSRPVPHNDWMRRFLLLMVLLAGVAAWAQTPAPGVIHSSVAVLADSSNSYALYLPSAYSPARRWPLLMVFDPFARGEVAVKLFQEAAEQYGFLVVGSNNVRNFQDPSAAVQLLWKDVNERYAVDPRRFYVAGLSGGARVASSIALTCKTCVAGVIANGAGLLAGAAVPGPEVADWFLVAGTTDFNYPELLHLDQALEERHAAVRFVVYDGPHNWMPKELAGRALAWLQLRAMVRGTAAVDKEFVARQFDERLADAQAAQKRGDLLAAVRAYREFVQDFRSFREVKEVEAAAQSLAASEEFRKAQKNEQAALDLQDELTKNLVNLVGGIAQGADEPATLLAQLQSAADDARREQKKASNPARAQAIERALASAFSYAAEGGQQAMLKKNYLAARELYRAGEAILPQSAWACYLLASAEAQLGEKKQAIHELQKAMERGLTNAKLLDDSAFDRIRGEDAFKQLVAKLSQASTAKPKS